jgi:hypothetical protein
MRYRLGGRVCELGATIPSHDSAPLDSPNAFVHVAGSRTKIADKDSIGRAHIVDKNIFAKRHFDSCALRDPAEFRASRRCNQLIHLANELAWRS